VLQVQLAERDTVAARGRLVAAQQQAQDKLAGLAQVHRFDPRATVQLEQRTFSLVVTDEPSKGPEQS
jgi:hypothetical protein